MLCSFQVKLAGSFSQLLFEAEPKACLWKPFFKEHVALGTNPRQYRFPKQETDSSSAKSTKQ
jgi:hypothetical protein